MSDLTAMGQYFAFWYPQVPNWITVLFIVLILISFNLLGARLFGELEFWFSIIKVVTNYCDGYRWSCINLFSHLKHIMDMHHSQT